MQRQVMPFDQRDEINSAYIINSAGPRTEPCGTPPSRREMFDRTALRWTYTVSNRKDMTETSDLQTRQRRKSAAHGSAEYRYRCRARCRQVKLNKSHLSTACCGFDRAFDRIRRTAQQFQGNDPTGSRIEMFERDRWRIPSAGGHCDIQGVSTGPINSKLVCTNWRRYIVHLCALFCYMIFNQCVPDDFGKGLIFPLLRLKISWVALTRCIIIEALYAHTGNS